MYMGASVVQQFAVCAFGGSSLASFYQGRVVVAPEPKAADESCRFTGYCGAATPALRRVIRIQKPPCTHSYTVKLIPVRSPSTSPCDAMAALACDDRGVLATAVFAATVARSNSLVTSSCGSKGVMHQKVVKNKFLGCLRIS